MTMTDPIADMLTRLRNANSAYHDTVGMPYSKIKSHIADIKRVSKPGLRVYAKKDNLPRVLNGLGVAIISTSGGLLTDKQAKKRGVGGEVLAYVW
jgi:small subunit ribosomal protein S8